MSANQIFAILDSYAPRFEPIGDVSVTRTPHPRFDGDVVGVMSRFVTSGHDMTQTPVTSPCGSIGWAYACSCGLSTQSATPCFDGCHGPRRQSANLDGYHAELSLHSPS